MKNDGAAVGVSMPFWRKNYSLLTRLSIWYIASTFLLVSSASLYLYWSLAKTLEQKDVHLLSDRLETIRLLLAPGQGDALRQRVETEWANRKYERLYAKVTNQSGRVLAETPGVPPAVEAIFDKLESSCDTARATSLSYSVPAEDLAFRSRVDPCLVGSDAGSPASVRLVLDRTNEEQVLALHRQRLYFVLAVTALFCVLLGRRLAARAVEPINGMAVTAARIRSSTLHPRMSQTELPVELGRLAVTFNGMMEHLEDAFSRLSRFCADLAHELRTPIGNMIGELEVALGRTRDVRFYQDTMGSALEECQRVAHIIDSLLFLARAEDPGRQLKKERVNLLAELRGVVEFYEAAAAEAGVWFDLDVASEIEVAVERTLFHRAIGNVIANALRYAKNSGELTISACESAGQVRIEIRDAGEGIPARHLPKLTDRFYRVDESRTKESGGTGLGLAIVKSIAAIHGGSVEIESELGRGTTVRFRFPEATART